MLQIETPICMSSNLEGLLRRGLRQIPMLILRDDPYILPLESDRRARRWVFGRMTQHAPNEVVLHANRSVRYTRRMSATPMTPRHRSIVTPFLAQRTICGLCHESRTSGSV